MQDEKTRLQFAHAGTVIPFYFLPGLFLEGSGMFPPLSLSPVLEILPLNYMPCLTHLSGLQGSNSLLNVLCLFSCWLPQGVARCLGTIDIFKEFGEDAKV